MDKGIDRKIVLDTETTGISPADGHRIIEIGCVELIDMRKGENRQWYINPERDIPEEATRVHGITNEQVADCPKFHQVAKEFLEFIEDSPLVIHNAAFDMRFLNAELAKIKRKPLDNERAIDTLIKARRKFPGSAVSLDALCKRFGIDNSQRTFHGALLDSHLLAEVYVELMGGNQFTFMLDSVQPEQSIPLPEKIKSVQKRSRSPRIWSIPEEEQSAHQNFIRFLDEKSGGSFWSA
ncbi:DNA polymerase III subunit epsilon [Magnetococcales bacterium HHB-1]